MFTSHLINSNEPAVADFIPKHTFQNNYRLLNINPEALDEAELLGNSVLAAWQSESDCEFYLVLISLLKFVFSSSRYKCRIISSIC